MNRPTKQPHLGATQEDAGARRHRGGIVNASHPTPGTDAARVLDALLNAYPDAAYGLNSRLLVTAHSRVADLRKLGWAIESVSRKDPSHPKGRDHGYKLVGPAEALPATDSLFPLDQTYRRGVA